MKKRITLKEIQKRLDMLETRLHGDGSFCPHVAPLILVFEEDGTLRDEPRQCFCGKPPRLELVSFVGTDDTAPLSLPEWLVPALEVNTCKVLVGVDLANV